jgi:hypothetical protein
MLKSKLLITALLLYVLSVLPVNAQRKLREIDPQQETKNTLRDNASTSFKDRLLYGGNAWMSFGSNFSLFMLQPQVAYRVNDNFLTGVGATYLYMRESYVINGRKYDFSDNMYGMNLFARHTIFGPVFGYSEYAPMNFNSYNSFGDRKRVWGQSLNLGAGYSQSFGGAGAYIILLYDVLWKPFYPSLDPNNYAKSLRLSPWDIRMGFLF